ncbi:MAG: hypothetical protein IJA09_06710 [Bacteroidales bacterium]|nr:hypothetical protein [Bacteroidales bacterium]
MKYSNYTFDTVGYYPTSQISSKSTEVTCKCAEPVIIVNTKLRTYLYSIKYLHYIDYNLKYSERFRQPTWTQLKCHLAHNKTMCNYANINQFYAVIDDGEIVPLYILVPCNKCFICKDKLSKMWEFRAIAETNYSKHNAYFVTLTYNDNFKPIYGVNKRAVQLFLKRLRYNLDELGIEHSLKYIACGEYGKNTKRPHYHLIIWHFPDDNPKFPNLTSILHFIEQSWSVYNFETEEYIPIGFAYCKIINKYSIRYVMKYNRKPCKIPQGCNPCFFLCSKYIGIQWFFDNYIFLERNPQLLTLSIKDPIANETFTSAYPTYYKQKVMPDFCKIFPKEIIDSYNKLLTLHTQLQTLNDIESKVNYTTNPILYKYYDILHINPTSNVHPIDTCYIDSYYSTFYNTFYNYQIFKKATKLKIQYNTLCIILTEYYNLFIDKLTKSNQLKHERFKVLSQLPQKHYTLDLLRVENEKLQNKLNKKTYNKFEI